MHIIKYISDFAFVTSSPTFYWDMESISIQKADDFFSKWWSEDREYLTIRFRNQQSVDKIRDITNLFNDLTTNSHIGIYSHRFPSAPCEMLILKVWEPPNKSPRLYCDHIRNVNKSGIASQYDIPDDIQVIPFQSPKDQKEVESNLLTQLVKITNDMSDLSKRERAKKAILDIFGFIA